MIESRELMIGNWVKHNDLISGSEYPGTVFQWSTAHWYDIETCGLSFGSIEGIPLTGEVLSEWCGFEKDIHFYTKRITTELQVTVGVKSGDLSLMTPYFGTDFPMPHIKYLHQLQNMIYAVSGRELEVKTP